LAHYSFGAGAGPVVPEAGDGGVGRDGPFGRRGFSQAAGVGVEGVPVTGTAAGVAGALLAVPVGLGVGFIMMIGE